MTAAAPFYILINGSPMHATGQPPYQFATYEEAAAMVDICYGLGAIDKFLTINHPPQS